MTAGVETWCCNKRWENEPAKIPILKNQQIKVEIYTIISLSNSAVWSTDCSGQQKDIIKPLHYCLSVRQIFRWTMDSPPKEPVIRKIFRCHDIIIGCIVDNTRGTGKVEFRNSTNLGLNSQTFTYIYIYIFYLGLYIDIIFVSIVVMFDNLNRAYHTI